ncbi:hypothetical protein RFI_39825 [Reticulomyxa filosa]|uniref:Kelch motif family protein n=1 Tax=Reticulomyxa filosa TaxID=46433 RepID=X6L891_RETFI|nr:hypothetical protein RFI_39825 [Reticulomyxa filosa]|eukprot:ETN97700.1 hypothetical protein RFI_39825 [Reticulomyxa filosa]
MSNQTFQFLKELPTPLSNPPCVLYKDELLICGGDRQRTCYSYHTIKNEYKFICEYPSNVKLAGHCVVKLVNNNNNEKNQITLLSFGSYWPGENKHTLVMKYVSVWSNTINISNELNNYNQWIPFTDNQNHPIIIGKDENHDYEGVRAVIGGSNNHLLFITCWETNISVFDLNMFQFIKHDTLPIKYCIRYHCFISNSENVQGQGMMKTNKQHYQMLLFGFLAGLSIEYDEDNNSFEFHQLPLYDAISSFNCYAYICTNDIILFFGGLFSDIFDHIISESVHKYSIKENKWITFKNVLPIPSYYCVAILDEEDNDIHIIGGKDDSDTVVSTYMKTKMREWDPSQLSKNEMKCIIQYLIRNLKIKIGWIDDFDKIIIKYSR